MRLSGAVISMSDYESAGPSSIPDAQLTQLFKWVDR